MSLACLLAPLSASYRPREPASSPLYKAVQGHLETFLATHDVPGYVRRSFRRFLACGVLAKGFVRVRCRQCGEELLVAHSCKDRGFCPSCTARRGAETAAHLVDDVLPHVPLRQFVLSLPFDLHLRAARDAQAQSALLTIFVEELRELLRGLTKTGEEAECGSVTFVQLFGSSLNLHVHFHLLALDGVYVADGEGRPPRFVRALTPTHAQLAGLVRSVAVRARQMLSRRPAPDPVEELQQPAFKLFGAEPFEVREPNLKAAYDGFDLQAATAFEADERVAVERFCRYGMRGPLALNRLSQGPKDTLLYRLKTPKPDGTTHLVFTPMTLLERLARLVPLPDKHLVRYHGVLAPAAAWRAQVVPAKPVEGTVLPRTGGRRIVWADLLRRVFALEILACACGGTRQVIASIDEGPVARKILQHLGLPSTAPALAPARLDQGEFWQTGPPRIHDRAPLAPFDFDQRTHPLTMSLSNHAA